MDAQPSWSDLQLLLAIASEPSLLAAARKLGVEASTLSRRMTQLETATGHKLLLRGPSGVRLTASAESLVAATRTFDQQLDRVLREAQGGAIRGTVRLSAGDGFGDWLVRVVDVLQRAHPDIAVDLVLEERLADLPRFEADLGLRVLHAREGSLVYEKLGELAFGLFASQAYLDRAGAPRRAGELERHRFVGALPPADQSAQHRALRAAAAVHGSIRTTFPGQLVAARRGLGIALLPALVADDLVRVLPRLELPPMPLWLAWHREARQRPEVRALAQAIRADAARSLGTDRSARARP